MQIVLTFTFPETGDHLDDVILTEGQLALVPLPGDYIAAKTFFNKEILRRVYRRSFRYGTDGICAIMLTCGITD